MLSKVLSALAGLLVVVSIASSADAQCPKCGGYHYPYNQAAVRTPVRNVASAAAHTVGNVAHAVGNWAGGCDDALYEVNQERARRGLRPFLPDPALNQAARSCAQIRASRRISGHLPNDFSYVPAGASARSAGCGAMEASWGWGTCCTYENYTYAGAAWYMGSDGKRYMHLFVR